MNTILEVKHISKHYPGILALDNVTLAFKEGEVHAIVGENGAGKSTLIKAICGAEYPTEGKIIINDGFGGFSEYKSITVELAKKNGIAVIYQEFMNVGPLSAAENVFLGVRNGKSLFVSRMEMEKWASILFKSLGVDINPAQLVNTMSPAYQQIVEIAKAVSKNARLIIMDEPTAPLTVNETALLFNIIRDLKDKGVTIIYISHRLEELFDLADRVTVMRDGRLVDTLPIEGLTKSQLIAMMVGRDLSENYPSRSVPLGEEILKADNLSGNGDTEISFTLHAGEILGFAGLVGSGRTELMQMIYGSAPISGGQVTLRGSTKMIKTPAEAIRYGVGMVPEDRKAQGLFLRQSVKWNIVINSARKISRWLFVDKNREDEIARHYQKEFNIKTPNLSQTVTNLSGGNQQKVSLAKTMAANSDIIIFDEPTRGIDVGAKQEIYMLMNRLASKGKGILMVSSDMPELMGMSDRIVVISEGRQTGILEKNEFDQQKILTLASVSAPKGENAT
jgi:ribose transport system ATP-binding protein